MKFVKLCVLLVIGALVSLLQTWWAIHFYENTPPSTWRPNVLRYPYTLPYDRWQSSWVEVDRGGEPLLVSVSRDRGGRVFQVRSSRLIFPDPDQSRDRFEIPSWSLVADPRAPYPVSDDEILLEQGNGWPMVAWYGAYAYNPTALESRGIWSVPDDAQDFLPVYLRVTLFPYKPIWSGLLINAMVFGAISWGVFRILRLTRFGLVFVRRHERLRLRRCPDCNYDVTGLTTCPECGEPVPERVPKRDTIGS